MALGTDIILGTFPIYPSFESGQFTVARVVSKASTSMVYITFGFVISLGVGVAYYSQQAVQSPNEIIR